MAKNPLSILPGTGLPETGLPEPGLPEPGGVAEESMEAKLAKLNRVVHEPARLAILTVLAACVSADFVFLQTATGLSKGNLSVQLTRLEEAGLIASEKTIERKRTLTRLELTKDGRAELVAYWRQMQRIQEHSARASAQATAVVTAEATRSKTGRAGKRLLAAEMG